MNRFDLTPLYRSTIGFDRLASLFDAVQTAEKGTSFPPYNVERPWRWPVLAKMYWTLNSAAAH